MERQNEKELMEMLETLRAEHETTKDRYLRLQESYDSLKSQYDKIMQEKNELEEDLNDIKTLLEEREKQYTTNYEIFRCVHEDENIVLIDATYTIRYVNQSSAEFLRLPHYAAILGRRIFDFFQHKDAIKLKDKIDDALIKGGQEKIKDIKFQNLKGEYIKIKIKMSRVRYEYKPSIKMTIK
jgi:hypothetical protein